MVVSDPAEVDQYHSSADMRQSLFAVATTVRTFLRPHWHSWHKAWGPPAPITSSQWTCLRSSLLLARAIEQLQVSAALRSGQPVEEANGETSRGYGLLTVAGWVSHAWVEAAGLVIDITADQFGYAPVVVTSIDDYTYRCAEDQAGQLTPTRAGLAAVEEIWPSWCSYVDQARPL